ncbi:MAG: hypothetical protein ACLT0Y_01610 [Christensenellales bacterium]
MSWLGGMTLESCVAVPGHAPYYLVHFNQQAGAREAAAKPMTARNRQETHDRPQPLQRAALRQEPLARQKRGCLALRLCRRPRCCRWRSCAAPSFLRWNIWCTGLKRCSL